MIHNNQAKMDVVLKREEMRAKLDAHREEMMTEEEVIKARQETTEACLEKEEPTSLEVESVAVHAEVPKKEVAVETSGTLKKQNCDQHLAVGCSGKPKERTESDGGRRLQSDDPPCHSCAA
jgi:hypothetical protein